MNKTILITGANGTLAKKLIEKLSSDDNFQICASSRNIEKTHRFDNVQYINNVDLIKTDILSKVDFILNCAFPRDFKAEILAEAMEFYAALVEKAVEQKVKGIINISSQDIYGTYRENPSSENDKIHPENNYALTKHACEIIGSTAVKNSDTKLTNIRLGSLIGKEYPERVINKIITRAFDTKSISINNDKNVFGYMDVEDAVNGLIAFVNNSNPKDWAGIYNFGAKFSEQRNFEYIANTIRECFRNNNIDINLQVQNAEKADRLCLLNSKEFYLIANWQPEISLRQSIENIFAQIVQNQKQEG